MFIQSRIAWLHLGPKGCFPTLLMVVPASGFSPVMPDLMLFWFKMVLCFFLEAELRFLVLLLLLSGVVKEVVTSAREKKNQASGVKGQRVPPPAAKAQVVGWPPIRSFRKNSMAINPPKNEDDAEGKLGSGCLYVKVSMDGAPYLRKVDLKTYSSYFELSSGLEKMFSCFTIGQSSSHGATTRDGLSESRLVDLLHGSEYVLTYEDKDGDWMLVGDVPWNMFTETCKRMRIMKSSDATGLAPRAMEKCRNRN